MDILFLLEWDSKLIAHTKQKIKEEQGAHLWGPKVDDFWRCCQRLVYRRPITLRGKCVAHGIVWLPHSHNPNGTVNLTFIDSQRIWLNQSIWSQFFILMPLPTLLHLFLGKEESLSLASNFGIEIALVKDIMIGWKNRKNEECQTRLKVT